MGTFLTSFDMRKIFVDIEERIVIIDALLRVVLEPVCSTYRVTFARYRAEQVASESRALPPPQIGSSVGWLFPTYPVIRRDSGANLSWIRVCHSVK